MSDFDFDELDKAVNGAIGSDDTTAQEPAVATPAEAPRSVEREAPLEERSSVTPAARRAAGGRFMDMVHPSSDMRSSSPVAARPTTPTTPTTPAPASRLPEPPRFTQPEAPVKTPVEPTPSAADWSSTLESPFLPDAKVEKRPLGGVEPETPSPLLSSLLDEPKEDLLEAPDELRLEATTLPDPIDFSPEYTPTEPEKTEQPEVVEEVEAVENEEVAPVETPEVKSVATPSPEASNTPISITQQYKEQPRAEQESGAIYDTEAYHQPITHPAKKRSGWWIVLWIFLLIVLGAGAGAAVYLYVLPLL